MNPPTRERPLAAVAGAFLLVICLCASTFPGLGRAVQVGNQCFQASPVPGSCKRFTAPQTLKLGKPAVGSLPAESCAVFRVAVSEVASNCARPDSFVLLEFWALSWDPDSPSETPPSMQVVDDVYMLAARGTQPPTVTITEQGRTTSPPVDSGLFWDRRGVTQRRSYQVVRLRAAEFIHTSRDSWTMTIANLHPQRRTLGRYSVRASCQSSLPCPSASPLWGACSSNVTLVMGQITTLATAALKSGGPVLPAGRCRSTPMDQLETSSMFPLCQCSRGFGDYACSSPVINMSDVTTSTSGTSSGAAGVVPAGGAAGGATQQQQQEKAAVAGARWGSRARLTLQVPPRTWLYLWVDVPAGPLPRLLVELSQPAGSGDYLDPILVVQAARSTNDNGIVRDLPVPTLADLRLATREGSEYQDVRQTYVPVIVRATTEGSMLPDAVWVAIFNNAPLPPAGVKPAPLAPSANPAAPYSVHLRVRVDGGGPSAAPVCPLDCSGRGVCSEPPKGSLGSYMCRCNFGFGGPWCQGAMHTIMVDSPRPQSQGWAKLNPGQWEFFTINFSPAILMAMRQAGPPYRNLAVSLQIDGQPLVEPTNPSDPTRSSAVGDGLPGPVYLIISPFRPGLSVGDEFFSSTRTYSYGGSVQLRLGSMDLSSSTSWVVAVYSSDLDQPLTTSTYSLTVTWQPNLGPMPVQAPQRAIPWYTVFIGAAAGSIVLTLTGVIVARMVLWRVHQHRARATNPRGPGGPGAGLELITSLRQNKGVPQVIIATFPLLQYSSPDKLAAFVQSMMPPPSTSTSDSGSGSERGDGPGASLPLLKTTITTAGGGDPGDAAGTGAGLTGRDLTAAAGGTGGRGGMAWAAAEAQGSPRAVFASPQQQGQLSRTAASATNTGATAAAQQGQQGQQSPRAAGGVRSAAASLWRHALHVDVSHAPSCSVCISEYEVGDLLRVLRPCAHPFHKNCIDTWLEHHDTCPMCRTDLCAAACSINSSSGSSVLSGGGGGGQMSPTRRQGFGRNTFGEDVHATGVTPRDQHLSLIGAATGGDVLPSWHDPHDRVASGAAPAPYAPPPHSPRDSPRSSSSIAIGTAAAPAPPRPHRSSSSRARRGVPASGEPQDTAGLEAGTPMASDSCYSGQEDAGGARRHSRHRPGGRSRRASGRADGPAVTVDQLGAGGSGAGRLRISSSVTAPRGQAPDEVPALSQAMVVVQMPEYSDSTRTPTARSAWFNHH